MKKVCKGIVEGDIIRLDEKCNFPIGTRALITLKTMNHKGQKEIRDRQLKMFDEGFYLRKKFYSTRGDLYAR